MNSSLNAMYSKLSNMVFGFHGCDKETFDNVLYKHQQLKISDNAYDWLGNGMYFWENSTNGHMIGPKRSIKVKLLLLVLSLI